MGLFDDLFGTKSKATSNTQTTGTQNETQTGQQTGTSNQSTTGTNNTSTTGATSQNTTDNSAVTAKNVTSNLDANSLAALQALIPGLAANAQTNGGTANINADALRHISSILFDKGNGGDAGALADTIAVNQASARREFDVGEGQQAQVVQQAIGSKGNTFSQLVQGKANADLAGTLNQVASEATLKSQAQSSADLTGAASVLGTSSAVGATDASSALAPLLAAIDALKGSQTTSDATQATTGTSATNQTTASTTLEQLLQTVLGNTTQNTTQTGVVDTTGTSATQGKQTSSPGIIPAILSLFN